MSPDIPERWQLQFEAINLTGEDSCSIAKEKMVVGLRTRPALLTGFAVQVLNRSL
jgi:hypothetical protein